MKEDYILPDLDDNFFKDGLIASIKDYDKMMGSVAESERRKPSFMSTMK